MLHAHKGEGIPSIYWAFCYQPINKDVPSLSPLSLSLPFFLLCPSASAQQPIHLMQFPSLRASFEPPPQADLSFPPSCAVQVMSFFFSWIPLPSPSPPRFHSFLCFPLAAGSPQNSIPFHSSFPPRLAGGEREGTPVLRCER